MDTPSRRARSFPDPLQHPGVLRPSAWMLPSTALSILSPLALLVVTATMMGTAEHWGGLRLRLAPFAAALPVAAALLPAWILAWRCGRRPGRYWPRLWALGLALACTASTPVSFVYGFADPLLPSLNCGLLAACLFLLPRLVHLHPDSAWIARIPWVMFLALVLFFAALMAGVTTVSAGGFSV